MKRVYFFGDGKADGHAGLKDLLGGKGANLAEMTNLHIPVPPGFTITTECCREYFAGKETLAKDLKQEALSNLQRVEDLLGFQFGSKKKPLLLSVRSGARVSMPGMMDTILNLGLNDETVTALAKLSGDERFAYDSYRRLIQMYSNVVLGLKGEFFSYALDEEKRRLNLTLDTELKAADLKRLVKRFKEIVRENSQQAFPEDPHEQLWGAVAAVFRSWHSKRAVEYRRIENISAAGGTAVNVQAMVFGNMGEDCATGVAFTRDPSTGEKHFFGEYLINAQGEDVVAGIRTPQAINRLMKTHDGAPTLEETLPIVYAELIEVYKKLERHYRDMQDIEFTIQKGKLWLLQTRNGKRTARAALKIASDLVTEGLLTRQEAIKRITPAQLDRLLHPQFDEKAKKKAKLLAKGLPASPGAATGMVVFSADDVAELVDKGRSVILVRAETSPEDIHGMNRAAGILTARGGMTSHAAVVARGLGKPCVAGCSALEMDEEGKQAAFHTKSGWVKVKQGDTLSLDGATGEVMLGKVGMSSAELTVDFERLMQWCDEFRRLKVRANADLPRDAQVARKFGAEGIGLCRTEHMFFGADRIFLFRQMILADDEKGRRTALKDILPLQRGDFIEIFRVMKGFPVTIRLLDPPLHEFLPRGGEELRDLAKALKVSDKKLELMITQLTEANPMLGHRGCRLGITFPEIYETQVRAIFEAALHLREQEAVEVVPELMIPLVSERAELAFFRLLIARVYDEVVKPRGQELAFQVGTMIELPRAALTADAIAQEADFFSFGTNDLTQTVLGLSRDDVSRFLPVYLEKKIFAADPFVTLDQPGVGELMRLAKEKGRKAKPSLRLSVCGEHGGDPASIHFCHQIGLDYVSCSPYRVPIARLAAAHAALEEIAEKK